MCLRLVALCLTLLSAARGENISHKTHFKIGGLAIKGVKTLYDSWNETFSTYLTTELFSLHGWTFELVPLNFSSVYTLVASGEIDFVYANPSIFSCLESEYQVRSMVSQNNLRRGQEMYSFGGTIITHIDNTHYDSLTDLNDTIVEAVSISGLGACQMQWRLLKSRGVDFLMDPKQVRFAKNQKKIVHDVLNKAVDFGFIRTDLLESMEASIEIPSGMIKVIEPKNISGFPFQTTTELYPEWNVGSVPGVNEMVIKEVVRVLLEINSTTQAAKTGKYSSWIPPLSYLTLNKMQVELGWINEGRCIRSEQLYESIVCGKEQAKLSPAEVDAGCPSQNLSCPAGYECLCRPCKTLPKTEYTVKLGERPESERECHKLDNCGEVEQTSYATVTLTDNLFGLRSRLDNMTAVHKIETRYRHENDWIVWPMDNVQSTPGTFSYNLSGSVVLGNYLLEIRVNEMQIEQSPFVISTVPLAEQAREHRCGKFTFDNGMSCECLPGDLVKSPTYETTQDCIRRHASEDEQRRFWVLHMLVTLVSTVAAASCLYEFHINPFLTSSLGLQSTLALYIPDFVMSSMYFVFQFANLMSGKEPEKCNFVSFLTFGSIIATFVGPVIVAFSTLAMLKKIPLTRNGLSVIIVLPWILGAILASVSLSVGLMGSFRGLYCLNTTWDHGLSGGLIFTVLLLAAVSTICLYAASYQHIRGRARQSNLDAVAKRGALVVGILFLCWAMFAIVGLSHWAGHAPWLWMDSAGALLASCQPIFNWYVLFRVVAKKKRTANIGRGTTTRTGSAPTGFASTPTRMTTRSDTNMVDLAQG